MNKFRSKALPAAVGACILSVSFSTFGALYDDVQDYYDADPLFGIQWHLYNTTSTNWLTPNEGDVGNHVNVVEAHNDNEVTGESVKVAVVDSGLEIAHEDLEGNVLPNRSRNYVNNTNDPTPTDNGGDHGTSVAGLIAAEGFNGIGGRGVAPKAQLMGFNWLENQSATGWEDTHGGTRTEDAQVVNQSYGFSPIWPVNFDSTDNESEEEHLADVTSVNNDGKGIVFVKSAGNSFRYLRNTGGAFTYGSGERQCIRQIWGFCLEYGNGAYTPDFIFSPDSRDTSKVQANSLPAQIAGSEPSNSSFFHTTISALSAGESLDDQNLPNGDILSSYSSVGASVWVSAHGGEYGEDYPAMITTDLEGCDRGYAVSSSDGAFNSGDRSLNPECNYTSTFNGTSSAAPVASGVFALVLDANSDLTWRDAKHIVAVTADKIAENFEEITVDTGRGGDPFVAEPGWITNGAGHEFHNWYGFGRVNSSAAVEMAQDPNYELLPALQDTDFIAYTGSDQRIPDTDAGRTQTLNVDADLTIEAVQVKFSITHGRDADLAIELISPAGTSSMVVTPRSMLILDQGNAVSSSLQQSLETQTDFNDTVFLTNAFYGENSEGEWQIKVTDTNTGDFTFYGYTRSNREFTPITTPDNTSQGVLTDWSIRIYGH